MKAGTKKYVVKYFLNFYANTHRYHRHACNHCRVYEDFNHGNPQKFIVEIEESRQSEALKKLRPYTTVEQRKVLKERGMKWGHDIMVLSDGTYFI